VIDYLGFFVPQIWLSYTFSHTRFDRERWWLPSLFGVGTHDVCLGTMPPSGVNSAWSSRTGSGSVRELKSITFASPLCTLLAVSTSDASPEGQRARASNAALVASSISRPNASSSAALRSSPFTPFR